MVTEGEGRSGPEAPQLSRSSGRQWGRRAVTIVVQVLAAMVLVGAILWILSEDGTLSNLLGRTDGAIPQAIGGYKLQKTVTGPRAIEELTAMHGTAVGLSGGWIGYYQAGGIVWYGDIVSEAKAADLIARMSGKIAAGNATFTNQRSFPYGGTTVYSVVGMGQQHYYYQAGKKAIWLAAPRAGEEAFLQDALRVLK